MLLRYERKYLVPNALMDALRKRLITFVVPDNFTSVNERVSASILLGAYITTLMIWLVIMRNLMASC